MSKDSFLEHILAKFTMSRLMDTGMAKLNSKAKVTLNNCFRKVFGIIEIVSMSHEFVNKSFST